MRRKSRGTVLGILVAAIVAIAFVALVPLGLVSALTSGVGAAKLDPQSDFALFDTTATDTGAACYVPSGTFTYYLTVVSSVATTTTITISIGHSPSSPTSGGTIFLSVPAGQSVSLSQSGGKVAGQPSSSLNDAYIAVSAPHGTVAGWVSVIVYSSAAPSSTAPFSSTSFCVTTT